VRSKNLCKLKNAYSENKIDCVFIFFAGIKK